MGVRRLTLALIALALAAAPLAAAAGTQWETWTNPDEGFRITIPKSWFLVPNSVAKVKSDIDVLVKENAAQVAQIYEAKISTAQERSALAGFVFQAFAYSSDPVLTTVTVAVSRTSESLASASGLAAIGRAQAAADRAAGKKVADARVVTLPAGRAAYIDGSYRVSGHAVDFAEYVVAHGALLYKLSFAADADAPNLSATSTTIATIAQRFAFT